ncbi:TetR/AcrR family transcriptional regulator [Flavobacterium sp. N2270]|uniref:TetR/AcrR family transcriptional regulator n=1 Tax=Flavobacterium sp. N2270 TaxID=2986831 RepID=UPI0022257B7F|nr:TetR/AcrR family transcriptional regulator [Flavobacterium sp. N2270]
MKQDLKSELTKKIIIDEAFKLFYENGFKSTSIDKIMNASALTKGAFYHHYKSKKELGLEVISLKLQKRVHQGMIIPLKDSGDALKILELTFLNRIKSFPLYDKQHGCPMNNFINEIGDYEIAYQSALKKIIENWKAELVTLIERGQRENSIKNNISSQAVAVYLISAFEGIRGIRKLYQDDLILDEYLNGLSLYLNQLKP